MQLHPWLLLAWLFVLGTIIGSFLNVVVYRLPRGQNLIYPASRCPGCGRAIRWYDNVPILGWLWLRGRCRDCNAPIAARYPLVEVAVGVLFLVFGWNDLVRANSFGADAQPIPPQDFTLYGFHLMLLCPLFAATLIEADGNRIPRQLITWPSAAGILLAIAYPAVQALSFDFSNHSQSDGFSFWPLANSALGMIAAIILRLNVLRFLGVGRARESGLSDATLTLYAVSAFLGWQAALATGALAIIWPLALPKLFPTALRLKPTAIVFAATALWCLLESPLAELLLRARAAG